MKKRSTDTGNGVPADLNPDESRLGERTEFMTRAGRWCNGSTPPLWVEIRVRIPWRPLGNPLSDTVSADSCLRC